MTRPAPSILALLLAALAGCGGGPPRPAADGTLPPPPDARMTGLGMRIQTLVAEDPDGYTVPRALVRAGALQSAAPADPAQRSAAEARLAAAGIRVARIPLSAFPAFVKDLALVGDAGERWVGPSPDWTLVLSGPPWNFTRPIAMHDGSLTVPPGYARLLVRAWTTTGPISPSGPPSTMLRADVVPQLVESRAESPFADLLDPKSRRDLLSQGQWLLSLALETEIGPGEVLLLVPETPGLDWSRLPAPLLPAPPPRPDAPPPTPPEPADQPIDRPVIFEAPTAPDAAPELLLPSLGDALLTDSTALSRRSRKAIIALIPALSDAATAKARPR